MLTRLLTAASVVALTALSGCIAQLPHSPDTTRVQELGREDAEARLRDLMVRARAPQITDAEVQKDAVVYSATGLSPWWYTPYQGKAALLFSALDRIDLYENARTFVYDSAGAELSVILHQNVEDAREWIDLVFSFKSAWLAGDLGGEGKPQREAEPERNETKTDLMHEDGGSGSQAEPEGDETKKDLMQED